MKAGGPGPVRRCGRIAERQPWDATGGRGEGQESPDPHDGLNAGGERSQVSHLGTWCAVHHDGDGRGQQFLGELGRVPWGRDSSSWRPCSSCPMRATVPPEEPAEGLVHSCADFSCS